MNKNVKDKKKDSIRLYNKKKERKNLCCEVQIIVLFHKTQNERTRLKTKQRNNAKQKNKMNKRQRNQEITKKTREKQINQRKITTKQ